MVAPPNLERQSRPGVSHPFLHRSLTFSMFSILLNICIDRIEILIVSAHIPIVERLVGRAHPS
jgi:hypothetical protein